MSDIERVFEIGIREAEPGDVGFILDTFERSLRAEYKDAENHEYAVAVKRFLNGAIEDGATVLIAHPPLDRETIWGWSMTDGTLVLYAYVRARMRNARICARLLARAGIPKGEVDVAIMTNETRRLKYLHKKAIRYVPRI